MNMPTERPRWHWTRWLLLVSLIANGLLGGYLIGRESGPPPWPPMPRPPMAGEPGSPFAFAGVPPPLREAMREKLREGRPDMRARIDSLRAARATVRDAIAAEPLDPKQLETAFTGLRTVQAALQQDLHAVAVEVVAQMTPDERKRLSEWRNPEGRMREDREHRGR